MDDRTELALKFVGVHLAAVSAGIHLYLGLPRFLVYVQAGTPWVDPRMPLFLLSAFAVLWGLVWLSLGGRRDVVYALGIALMAGNVLAWLVMGGHGTGITPAWETVGHSHGGSLVTLFEHFFFSPYVLASKTAELGLVGVLAALLYDERRDSGGDRGRTTADDGPGSDGPRTDDPRGEDAADAVRSAGE